jgi:hypothetical protein
MQVSGLGAGTNIAEEESGLQKVRCSVVSGYDGVWEYISPLPHSPLFCTFFFWNEGKVDECLVTGDVGKEICLAAFG